MKLWKGIDWTMVKCAIRHITQYPSHAKATHCRALVEFFSDGETHFCHRSYLCCDKMLVSIATSSPVPRHAVRQKAQATFCTSSWTDKSVPIQWNKCCLIHAALIFCAKATLFRSISRTNWHFQTKFLCGFVFMIWCTYEFELFFIL